MKIQYIKHTLDCYKFMIFTIHDDEQSTCKFNSCFFNNLTLQNSNKSIVIGII